MPEKELVQYVSDHPARFEQSGIDTTLDTLYWNYIEANNLETEIIRSSLDNLYEQFCACIPKQDLSRLWDTLFTIITEYQRLGFHGGVRVGIQLCKELGAP